MCPTWLVGGLLSDKVARIAAAEMPFGEGGWLVSCWWWRSGSEMDKGIAMEKATGSVAEVEEEEAGGMSMLVAKWWSL